MTETLFETFFRGPAREFLMSAMRASLAEDGPDLTSLAVFASGENLSARIRAKECCVVSGLPIIPLTLSAVAPEADWRVSFEARDGDRVEVGRVLVRITGPAAALLYAERTILNFMCHMSGIASLTRTYVDALEGSRTSLLDTRKTLPGLRHAEKYAVLCGGGKNHRMDLSELLMLKDNHIDRAGSITRAVELLRQAYDPCPPIEVECRDVADVREAVAQNVSRIMLDNMDESAMREALSLVPEHIETEVSGGVSLANISAIGRLGPTFVSVGRLTHSAPAADLSMTIEEPSAVARA